MSRWPKLSEETKYQWTEKHRENSSIAHMGQKHTREAKLKISMANKGKKWTLEQKLKVRHKKKSLKQRVEALENIIYKKSIEKCPRCREMRMNAWQKGICNLCGYKKGD